MLEALNYDLDVPFSSPSRLNRKFAERATDAPDKDWDHEKELKGWGLGEYPLLSPYSVGGDALPDA